MYVIVTYDVSTRTAAGRKRLRRVAKACESRGQRVQLSVFECKMDSAEWVGFKEQLLGIIDLNEDSLRVYRLGNQWKTRVEEYGVKHAYDVDGPLMV